MQKTVVGQRKDFYCYSATQYLKYSTVVVYVRSLRLRGILIARHPSSERSDCLAYIHHLAVTYKSVEDVRLSSVAHQVELELGVDKEPMASGLKTNFK